MNQATQMTDDAIRAAAATLIGDRLIGEKELAHRWSCSEKLLQKARLDGTMVPFRRIGNRMIRYAMSDVLAYEAGQKRCSTSDCGGVR